MGFFYALILNPKLFISYEVHHYRISIKENYRQ